MRKGYQIILLIVLVIVVASIFLLLNQQQNVKPQFKQEALHQFENYKWGTSWNEVKEMIRNKKRGFNRYTETTKDVMLTYPNKILNESCFVRLIFTPKSRLLAKIELFWDMPKITLKDKLKTLLTKKYGLPHKSGFEKMYIWAGSSTTLLLDCEDLFNPSRVELIYSNNKYEKMREREIQKKTIEEAGEEIDRF